MIAAVLFALGASAAQIYPDTLVGACTAADQAKSDKIAQDLRKCFVEGNDSAVELQACVAKDGYTKACAGCVADLGVCMAKKCESMCQNGADSPHCKKCTEKNGKGCKKAFRSCSGIEKPIVKPEIEAPKGACMGAADLAKAPDFEKDIPACMQESQTASGIAACIEKDGFTAGCSKCVGTYGACVLDKCDSQCAADPTGKACKTCYTDKCMPEFYTCTGFPKPPPANAGACTGAADLEKAAGLEKDIPKCMEESQTASGIAQCIEKDGFTAGCSQCIGTYGACVFDKCDSLCESNDKACQSCIHEKCLPAFYACTGFPKPAAELEAPLAGQCTSAQDMKLGADLEKDIPACLTSSTDESGFISCIVKDGFTAGCAQCVGTFANCIMNDCASQCETAPNSAACNSCVETKCEPAFISCSGYPKPSSELEAPLAGQCTGGQDMSLAGGLEKFIPTCMEQSQTASGIASCIEKDGFTAGCSKCVGTYGACVIDKCGSQCEADPTGAACKTCYTDKCMPAFYTCSGFPKQPAELEAPLAGQCTSGRDMSLQGGLDKFIPRCMEQSRTASGIAQCIENDGFTAGCSQCIGTFGACIFQKCGGQCERDPTGQACKTCYTDKCMPAFDACTGFPKPAAELEAPLAGQCTGGQDMSLAGGLEKFIPKCMEQSQTASGIAACIKNDGFTSGCSQCVGTYGACVFQKCGGQCEADPTGAACKTCYTDKCMPSFYACSGFPKQPSQDRFDRTTTLKAADACMDSADQAVWNKDGKADFQADLSACGHQCLGGASCTSTCIVKRRGYTAACADCFGTLTGCTKDNCMFDCMMDADGSSCKNCVDKSCTPAFKSCSGLTPPSKSLRWTE